MIWIYLTLGSAFFLGIYDTCRKVAVNNNPVLPTLLCTTSTSASLGLVMILLSRICPQMIQDLGLFVPSLPWQAHKLLLIKSVIVGASWLCTYFGVKNLPITIAVPIRASAPVWTLLGAIIIYGERFTLLQWGGLITILVSYYLFSIQGKKEGINFKRNMWVYIVVLGAMLGAVSSMYDKYLMQTPLDNGQMLTSPAVLAWFLLYMAVIMAVCFGVLNRKGGSRFDFSAFQFRKSMVLVGCSLVVADWLYFRALSSPDAMIAIVSALRRSSVLISFLIGSVIFKESNRLRKGLVLCGVLAGCMLLLLSRHLNN